MPNAKENPVLAPGVAGLLRNDYAAAIHECTEALKTAPDCADAYCNRARAKRALGDLDGAIADATEAIRLDPAHAWGHRTLGDIHLMRGDAEKAIACCDQAIQLDPSLAVAYNTRAGARLRLKDFHGALSDCNQAIHLDPKLWGFYVTRANARYHLSDPNADDDYRTAFELNPSAYVRNIVQIIAVQVKTEPDFLFSSCAQYLQRNPDDTTSYTRRGIALVLLGRDAEAQLDFDRLRALKLNAKRPERLSLLIDEAKRLRASSAARETGTAPRNG